MNGRRKRQTEEEEEEYERGPTNGCDEDCTLSPSSAAMDGGWVVVSRDGGDMLNGKLQLYIGRK